MSSTPQICFLHNEYALSTKWSEYTAVKAVTPLHRGSEAITVTTYNCVLITFITICLLKLHVKG